jgi:hypothetical protein
MSGEPHVRIDRGRLAKANTHGEAEHAPSGKPEGLSLSDLPVTAEPAAYLTFYWRKRDLESFLRGHLRDFPELLAPLDFGGYKRSVAGELVGLLRRDEGRYQGLAVDMLVELSKFDARFPRLAREEDGEKLVRTAQAALVDVRKMVDLYSTDAEARAKIRAEIEAEAEHSAGQRGHRESLGVLRDRFLQLHGGSLTPQQRGTAFEAFLNELFGLFDLEPRAAYRLVSEQIDGAFTFRTDDYLLEARWWKGAVEPKDLRDFEGKIRRKAANVLGLLLSVNGFTDGARKWVAEGTPLILMDGQDLLAVLDDRIELPELLERKRRHAAHTGEPWLPLARILES